MRVSIITPTCDRPAGIALAEKYVARQTVQPHEWIVADSGMEPARLTMGQVHIRQPMPPGAKNLAQNIVAALRKVTGDAVVILEDDDWYHHDHIRRCVSGLESRPVYGCAMLAYYNVAHRCYIVMQNRGSALCQTAFLASEIPRMEGAARKASNEGSFCVDGNFWRGREGLAVGSQTVIGIKGIPGTPGLGIGHRPDKHRRNRWVSDPTMAKLREWIGRDDAEAYK